jgi:arylsulfatase
MARIAARGVKFANFHTTALCSPTRASLLTGRNATSNGMATIAEFASGFPGISTRIPFENGFISEVLAERGYSTYCVGKWHLTPGEECNLAAFKGRWPLGRGFERFYGWLGGETNSYFPDLVHDNHPIEPPGRPEDGYHLADDLASRRSRATSASPAARSTTSSSSVVRPVRRPRGAGPWLVPHRLSPQPSGPRDPVVAGTGSFRSWT